MSCSPHKLRLPHSLREVRVRLATDTLVSENKFRQMLDERYRQGYEAGQKALAEQLVDQRKQLLEIQNGVLRSISSALPQVVSECERSVVLLALQAARRVVENIPITAEMMEGVVRKALAELQDTAEYEVLLHPEDLGLLQQIHSGILPDDSNPRVKFGVDAGVTRGGCLIKTRHGAISVLREAMFDKLESAVLC